MLNFSFSEIISPSSCQDCSSSSPANTILKEKSSFLVNISLPLSKEELSNSNIIKIVTLEATDVECNQLCWKCLGYEYV